MTNHRFARYDFALALPLAALNGLLGHPLADTCPTTLDEDQTVCAQPRVTGADFDFWQQETEQ